MIAPSVEMAPFGSEVAGFLASSPVFLNGAARMRLPLRCCIRPKMPRPAAMRRTTTNMELLLGEEAVWVIAALKIAAVAPSNPAPLAEVQTAVGYSFLRERERARRWPPAARTAAAD